MKFTILFVLSFLVTLLLVHEISLINPTYVAPPFTPPIHKPKVVYKVKALSIRKYVPPPEEINLVIEEKASEQGVDPQLAKNIAYCESQWGVNAKNLNKNGTHDGGLFQINDVHLSELSSLGLDRFNAEDNITYAMMLIARNGTKDFNSSKHCWSTL